MAASLKMPVERNSALESRVVFTIMIRQGSYKMLDHIRLGGETVNISIKYVIFLIVIRESLVFVPKFDDSE